MAHELTDTDSMFSVREMPWHGLGTVLSDYPTRDEAQKIAHPWEPITQPVFRRVMGVHAHDEACYSDFGPGDLACERPEGPFSTFEEIEGQQEVVRSDNNDHIGVTNDTLGIVTNTEMYDIAEAVQGLGGDVMYETGGSLRGGRQVWLLLRLREPLEVKGDPHGATLQYFALQNNHDGGGSFRGQAINTRIVCANTSRMADMSAQANDTEIVFRHTKNVKDRIEEAKQALAMWRTSIADWQLFNEHLLSLKIRDEQREEFVERFFPMPVGRPGVVISKRVVTNIENERRELRGIFAGITQEGTENTAYGLVQGALEYSQHYRSTRGKSDIERNENRFRRSFLNRDKLVQGASKLAQEIAYSA
jgi:phage/plasmid-like protein (TIGR03299 family)